MEINIDGNFGKNEGSCAIFDAIAENNRVNILNIRYDK